MASFKELIVPISKEEWLQRILDLFELASFPVTAWQVGSVPLMIADALAEVLAEVSFGIAAIASGATFETAAGIWSKYRAVFYAEAPKEAFPTQGEFQFDNTNLIGVNIAPNTLIKFSQSPDTQYRVVEAFTNFLPAGGTSTLSVQAVKAGSAGNIAPGAFLEPVSGLSGVLISNPAIGLTGTWITVLGSDEETSTQLAQRLPGKWATLATGSPEAAIRKWALDQTGVTRARVRRTNPFGPGTVAIYIDSAAAVGPTQTYIDARIPAPSKAVVLLATTVSIDVPVTVEVQQRALGTALGGVVAALGEFAKELDIGDEIVKNELIQRIMEVDGVVDLSFSSTWAGTPNIQLGDTEIAVFDTTQIAVVAE